MAYIVERVIERLKLGSTAAPRRESVVRQYSQTALVLLKPFVPDNRSEALLTAHLVAHNASELTCVKAWALYFDYVMLEKMAA